MKKLTFGTPEKFVPSMFCDNFTYTETPVQYDINKIKYKQTARRVKLEFPLEPDECIFGLGLLLHTINHTHHKIAQRVNADPKGYTGDTHAPVPFFVTNKGYGVYVDTARDTTFNCGYIKPPTKSELAETSATAGDAPAVTTDELYKTNKTNVKSYLTVEIPAPGVDIYLIEGNSVGDIVAQYNMLSGGGCQVPDWGLGTLYRCYSKYTQQQVMDTADYFEEHDLPVSTIGLEPGWQSQSYACSFVWDRERYPEPQKMVDHLKGKGYHINLWEHAFTSSSAPFYREMLPYAGEYEVWGGLVPDFATEEARKIFSDYHKNHIVSMGIDGFKLDECDNSDYTNHWSFPHCADFPSGLDGEQYHNLFGTLYVKTMMEALNGTPTMGEVRNLGALAASYPFVLYSDLYHPLEFLGALTSSGLSGLLWSPEVRHADSKNEFIRRLQMVVFSAQCLINGWYCEELPWKKFDCEDEVRELLKVRESLIPRLKEAFKLYHEKGIPPVRPLVMDYTDDPETWELNDQYLFCDDLLVAPVIYWLEERSVYLPISDKWVDYWTGEPVENGHFTVRTDKIPVYRRVKE